MSAEQTFRESLHSFQTFGTENNSNNNSWFSGFSFNRNTENNEASQSLLDSFRTRASDGLANLGFGNNQPEDNPLGLSRFQRYVVFLTFCGAGALCFILSFFSLTMLSPKKFATLFTVGSILIIISFGILNGPKTQLKNMFIRERIPYTIIYIVSMIVTLYASIIKSSFLWTIIASVIQLLALIWFLFSFFPNGASNLTRVTRSMLPI